MRIMNPTDDKCKHYELKVLKVLPAATVIGTAIVMGILYLWLQLMKAL